MVILLPRRGGQPGEVPAALGQRRDGAVLVKGRRGPRAGKREEEEVVLVVGQDFRDIRRRQKSKAKAVRFIRGLLDGLTTQRKVLGVDRAVAAIPENRAVRLVGFEVAEVAAHATSASAAATASAEPAPTAPESAATTGTAAARPSRLRPAHRHSAIGSARRYRASGRSRRRRTDWWFRFAR